jgi:phospholipid/cholesterol/gamma-HCH transport system substrate-binding protein
VLNDNRAQIVETFTALRSFATVASRVLSETKDDFTADFKDLFPVIKALNDNVDYFIKGLEFLPTFPFHYDYLRKAVRGDYLNVYTTFDLTLRRVGESVFTTSLGLDPNMKRISEVVNPPDFLTGALANLSGQAADPFKIPPGTATQHDGAP